MIPRLSKAQTKLALKLLMHAYRHLSRQRSANAPNILEAMQLVNRLERDLAYEAVASGYYGSSIRAYHSCARSNCDWSAK